MSKEQAPGRIFMVKVPTQRVRSRFNLPESNRYFAKVLKNNKLISESNFDQKIFLTGDQKSSKDLNRSLSLSFSIKESITNNASIMKGSFSLPKINSKLFRGKEAGETQIVKSELGYLSFYSILRKKEEMEDKKEEQLTAKRIAKMTSVAQEEDLEHQDQHEEDHQKEEATKYNEERPYEQYDALLVRRQPIYYRGRHFRLKHQVDWRISV